MFIKITRSGNQRYVQLAVSQRDDNGNPRTKVLATLGRIGTLTPNEVDSVINGLLRVTGRQELTQEAFKALEKAPQDTPL